MISSLLAMTIAATAAQATDTTRSAREAYSACMRQFMQRSVEAGTTPTDFESALAQQCSAQESAYRRAVVQRETAIRTTRAAAEQTANEEVAEAKLNWLERYRMTMEPEEASPQ